MFSRNGFLSVAIPMVLVLFLFVLHAPALNLGLPIRGIDRLHDFWGGLLVEMIGVAIEIALIIFVLTELEQRRWHNVRQEIRSQLVRTLRDEIWRFKRNAERRPKTVEDAIASNGNLHEQALQNYTEASDFLQFTNNAFTPEMSGVVSRFMREYKLYIQRANNNTRVVLTPNSSKAYQEYIDGSYIESQEALLSILKQMVDGLAPYLEKQYLYSMRQELSVSTMSLAVIRYKDLPIED